MKRKKCQNLPSFPAVKEPYRAGRSLVNQDSVSLLITWRGWAISGAVRKGQLS